MMEIKIRHRINQNKGMAIMEVLPLLILFILLLRYGIGLFGIVHSAILHSISSRTYAFETFRNRTHTIYFRDSGSGLNSSDVLSNLHNKDNFRFHFTEAKIKNEDNANWIPEKLTMDITDRKPSEKIGQDPNVHRNEIFEITNRYRGKGVNPLWLQIGYGLCINADCGE